MGKIYDYTAFSSNKGGASTSDLSFGCELEYNSIDMYNRPPEYQDISDTKAFIDYGIKIISDKSGISDLLFFVYSIELEFSIDNYPNGLKEFDIDLIPGKTVDSGQIKMEIYESRLPTYPNKMEIDMNKSTDPSKFKIKVYFGSNV